MIGVPSERWGETPLAVVVLREGASATAEEIIAHCRDRMAHFKAPTRVEFAAALPRTANRQAQEVRVARNTLAGIRGGRAPDQLDDRRDACRRYSGPTGPPSTTRSFGRGYPLLLFAPGGVNSEIAFWPNSAVNPIRDFADEFMVIGMDQRHAGRSPAPAAAFSYDLTVGDQLAVLDDLGIERAHVMGGCIGVAYNLRIIQAAPGRISAAVCQDPVGVDASTSLQVFQDMFAPTLALARTKGVAAVVEAAMTGVWFVENNAAGPFQRRIHDDPAFRAQILAMSDAEYIAVIEDFVAGIWPPDEPLFLRRRGMAQELSGPAAGPARQRSLPPNWHLPPHLRARSSGRVFGRRLPLAGEAARHDRRDPRVPARARGLVRARLPGF